MTCKKRKYTNKFGTLNIFARVFNYFMKQPSFKRVHAQEGRTFIRKEFFKKKHSFC